MGLMKVDSSKLWGDLPKEGLPTADDPEVTIYPDGRLILKHYATRFLALCAVPETIQRIQVVAEELESQDGRPWTKADAERLIEAGGKPPAPSHVLADYLKEQAILLVRPAEPGAKNVRKLVYTRGSSRPSLTITRILRQAGLKVPPGTCLAVPVKLAEDQHGPLLAVLMSQSRSRPLHGGAEGEPSSAE